MFCYAFKIGVYYGNPEVTSGGIALKFFASVRLEIRSAGKIKSVRTTTVNICVVWSVLKLQLILIPNLLNLKSKGDEDIGLRARVRVQKSKVSSINMSSYFKHRSKFAFIYIYTFAGFETI